MAEHPERIYLTDALGETCWAEDRIENDRTDTEYVRADVHDAEVAALKARIAELENLISLAADFAVTDWNDAAVGKFDAIVPKPNGSYVDWARETIRKAKAHDELESANRWRPMSEAPKDGTLILVYCPYRVRPKEPCLIVVSFCDGHWRTFDSNISIGIPDSMRWRLLPDPPKE